MTLSLSLSPGAEARLVERAAAAGEDPMAFAARLLERAICEDLPAGPPPATDAPATGTAGSPPDRGAADFSAAREFDATLEELFAADTRQLPDARLTYSRDDIYFDHD